MHKKTIFKGIKKAEEYRRGEIAHDILRLVGAGVLMGAVVIAPNVAQVVDMFDPKGRTQRNRIWKAIKNLEQQERLRIEYKNGERYLVLTKRGQIALNDIAIEDLTIDPPRMWDRKWRIVMFDIPMHHSRARIPFREKLQDLGFETYQKSVFVHPFECREVVLTIAEHYGVRDFIRYMVAEEISHMREFVRKFDLL